MISSPVDEIKNKIDVIDLIGSYIKLSKAGRNYKANCPFHSEKTPSFMVSPERQIWHCFGCGKGGSIFDFIMEMEGVDFSESLKILAARAGVELKQTSPEIAAKWQNEKTRLLEICDLSTKFFVKQLEAGKTGQETKKYLQDRGLKAKTISEWQIGYAPKAWDGLFNFLRKSGYTENEIIKAGLAVKNQGRNSCFDRFRDRIMFPLKNQSGTIIGFTGRENPKSPDPRMGKYVNTPATPIYDKSRVLYGLDKAKVAIREQDVCVLVEGQMDVIMSHQAGFNNVVAGSGTALTEDQLKIIKRYTSNLALAYDMDSAGETAAKRGIDLALGSEMNTKVITIAEGKDPADCIKQNAKLWQKAVASAQDIIQFYFASAFSKNNPETSQGKKQIAQTLLPIIAKVGNQIEQAHWLGELAWRLKTSEIVLAEEMKKIKDLPESSDFQKIETASFDHLRNQNLEEYILGLVLAFPKALEQLKKESYTLFTNQDFKNVFQRLKKKKSNLSEIKKTLSPQLASRIDYAAFRAEAQRELICDFKPKKEMTICLNQLKRKKVQDQLSELCLAIKEAENKKDKKTLTGLMRKFSELSKQVAV